MSEREKRRLERELRLACEHGRLEETKRLVGLGVDPQSQDSDGMTPLHWASWLGRLDTVKYLVSELKCDPKVTDREGATPLHVASRWGRLDTVKYLVSELNCDPKVTDGKRRTPLHLASLNGWLDIVKYLVSELNCDPKVTDGEGSTPLHLASRMGELDTVKYLVSELNCDPKVTDGKGRTPLHLASQSYLSGAKAVVEYLTSVADAATSSDSKALDGGYTACLYTASSPSVRNERVALYTVCRSDSLMNTREFLERKLREKLPDPVIDPKAEIGVTFSSSGISTLIFPQPAGWTLSDPERYPPVENPLQISKREADYVESPTIMLTVKLKEESEAEPEGEIALQLGGFFQQHELLWKLFSQEGEQERATALVPIHDLPMIPTPTLHPLPSPHERTQKKKKGFLSDLWEKLKHGDRGKQQPQMTEVETRAGEEVRRELEMKPKIYDLKFKHKVVEKVQADWADLAYALQFKISTVKAIKKDADDVNEACIDMLSRWLNGQGERGPRTWATLLEALVDMEQTELAEEIRRKLK